MIIDTFSYFNEKELLELHIRLLYDSVDKFIICEGDRTHKGDYKGFLLEDTLSTLNIPTDKIQIVKVYMPSYEEQPNAWVRERMQRDAAMPYIKENDTCIVADLDEIPDPAKLGIYVHFAEQAPNLIPCVNMHNLQQRADQEVLINGMHKYWTATYVCKGKAFLDYTMSRFRENLTLGKPITGYNYQYIHQYEVPYVGGWHFSWMGDSTRKTEKMVNFAHWDECTNIHTGTDILGRSDHSLRKFDTKLLPELIFTSNNLKQFLLP